MHIESNFNDSFILERDCLNIDIESEDQENWHFSYKAVHGFVVGSFRSKAEAKLVYGFIEPNLKGTIRFVLNEELTLGEIQIEQDDSKEVIIVPFFADSESVKLYKRRNHKEK